jgi:predicted nucleic acid-binding protein
LAGRGVSFHRTHALAQNIHEPLLTCEAVPAETSYHLRNRGLVLRMLETGLIRLSFDIESHRPELMEMARRYEDRKPGLADLCLIRMSELYPEHPVITVDGDFRIYRRNRREAIPVVMPPSFA